MVSVELLVAVMFPAVVAVVALVDVVALPLRAAVIVPALKFPLPSRSTMVEAVFAVAYAIEDVIVVAVAATGNCPPVMPEIAMEEDGPPVTEAYGIVVAAVSAPAPLA